MMRSETPSLSSGSSWCCLKRPGTRSGVLSIRTRKLLRHWYSLFHALLDEELYGTTNRTRFTLLTWGDAGHNESGEARQEPGAFGADIEETCCRASRWQTDAAHCAFRSFFPAPSRICQARRL